MLVSSAGGRRLLVLATRVVVILLVFRLIAHYFDLDISPVYDPSNRPDWAAKGRIGDGLSWYDNHFGKPAEGPLFCSTDDWTQGRWHRREELFDDLDSVREGFGFDHDASLTCVPKTMQGSAPQDDPEHVQRILSVANWKYAPRGDCLLHQFNAGDFIKRSLRSKAGFTIVGDSLQEQVYSTLKSMLVVNGGPLRGRSFMPENVHTVELDLNHPDTADLLTNAGVISSRGNVPIVTYYRNNAILSRAEIDQCFLGKAAKYVSLEEHPEFKPNMLTVNTTWYTKWVDLLENAPSPIDQQSDSDIREEENVVLFSYGPHWTFGEIGELAQDELMPGYIHSIDILMDKLRAVQKRDIRAFYRTTAPGHPDCEIYDSAEPDRDTHKSTANPDKSMFNWDFFTEMNQVWAEATRNSGSMIELLDIWPMTVARPESHKNPPYDCLHFCQPGPPYFWIQFLWDQITSTSRSHDYTSIRYP